MSYQLFLFDLDGTLIDTSAGILDALRRTEKKLGITPLPDATLQKFIGPPLEWSFENFYHVNAETAKAWSNVYRELYGNEGVRLSRVYPYIFETLDLIRAHGGKSAVTSLKQDYMVDLTLGCYDMAPKFDAIVGRSDRHPTKADTICRAMELLDWQEPETTVLFGDSRYDGEGAMQAGISFVPLTYGFGFSEPGSLEGLPSVAIAHEPIDLLHFVERQWQE